MKTKVVLLFVVLFAASALHAANALSGKLVDANTRKPIDYANVTVMLPDSSILTGDITREDGSFLIQNLAKGMYIVKFSFLGYIDQVRNIRMADQDIDLGTIRLTEDTQHLQEVEVVAQGTTMRFELDRKVFSVDQNIASAGGSVTDVLENIPSVDVDQEGNISLRNDENVEIWINGKPAGLTAENRAQILEQLPAESIKEIELITNPSAKFSPEGTAGIINLVMKKDRKAGYYGSVSGGISYPWGGIPGGNVGFNINYSKGIVDTYLNLGYNYRTSFGGSQTDRKNIDEKGDTLTYLQQTGSNQRRGGGLFVRAGIDLHITDRSTLGFSGFAMAANRNHTDNRSTYLLTDYLSGDTLRHYLRDDQGTGGGPGGNAMISYQLDINKRHKLMATASYNHFGFSNDNRYTQIETDTLIQQQINDNTNQRVELKADYEWKPTDQSRFEAGWETDLSWQKTDVNAYEVEADEKKELQPYYNDFGNKEQTHALYVTYGNRFWDKLSLQVGLRGEYMYRSLNTVYYDETDQLTTSVQDTSYFQLFPSAYISYTFPHGHELQFNYTRRVSRPRGNQLNPRQDFSDSTNIQFGNPKLLPTYSSALELNYLKVWEKHTLSAGFFYRFADGVVQNVKYMDGEVMKNTYINIAKRQSVGLEVVGKNRLFGSLLQLTTSVSLYYNTLSGAEFHDVVNGHPVDVSLDKTDIFAWNARMNASFLFTKAFSGQITARYSSPRVVAQGKSSHSYSIDLGLRHTFLEKRLALSLNVRDLLNSRNRSSTTMGPAFWQYQLRKWNSRTIGLTLTYSFGNMNPKKSRQENKGMMDEYSGMGGDEE